MKDYQVTIDLAEKHLNMEEVDPDVWASDVAKLIRIIEGITAETLVMPKITEAEISLMQELLQQEIETRTQHTKFYNYEPCISNDKAIIGTAKNLIIKLSNK